MANISIKVKLKMLYTLASFIRLASFLVMAWGRERDSCVCVCVCVCVSVWCVCVCTTHHQTEDDSWHKADESWQPAQCCKYHSNHHTGHKGILGESDRGVSGPCRLLRHHCGPLNLGQAHSRLCKEVS